MINLQHQINIDHESSPEYNISVIRDLDALVIVDYADADVAVVVKGRKQIDELIAVLQLYRSQL